MIYFASDIHLGAGDPATARCTERRFTAWLDAVSRDAEAIYLLGDLFDFWFEYRRVVPQGFVRTLGKLAELTDRGVRVVFFTGNHDMWVGDYLHRECGVEIHTEPGDEPPMFVISLNAPAEVAEPDVSEMARVPREVLMRFIGELPEGYRAVFNLYCIEEYSHRDIARMLGINEKSSSSQLFRARAMLARRIRAYLETH